MKKVLIIGYFWPYRGGSARVLGLAKYLPDFGWEPIILTARVLEKPAPQFRVIETACTDTIASFKRKLRLHPNKGVQEQIGIPRAIRERKRPITTRLIKLIEGIITYPDVEKGWRSFASKAADEFLRKEEIEAMISVWPVTAHLIAREIKNKYKIPWVADFPDLWSQNHNYSYGALRRAIDKRLETKTLKTADILTTVSQPWADKLRKLHKGKSVYVMTHGFYSNAVDTAAADLTKNFTITYTGSIYGGRQDPSKFFAALKGLISEGVIDPKTIEVRFYGDRDMWLQKEIEEYGLSNIVKLYGRVPKNISYERQKESQVLLLLGWENQKEEGWHSFKIYDYLAARRQILVVGGSKNNVMKELINDTRSGIAGSSTEEIKAIVKEFYLEYKSQGRVTYSGDTEKINKHSYREKVEIFAEILNNLGDNKG